MTDAINPDHYKSHPSGVECIQITEHMDFCTGNAVKYLFRCGKKGGADKEMEDLEKARWYIDRRIALLKKQRGLSDGGVVKVDPSYVVGRGGPEHFMPQSVPNSISVSLRQPGEDYAR